ncbi:DUF1786 domain-containing protein [bacterium]|nr:DUF1786 domain-containing protein [bacterium]
MSKVLTFDIGSGTLDVLLWDSEKNIENCIKLVLPSPNQIMTKQIEDFEGDTLKVDGYTVGGGKCSWAIKDMVKQGKKVLMTPTAGRLVRDDLDRVRKLGIDIVDQIEDPDFFLREIDFDFYRMILKNAGEDIDKIDFFGFALQDHGCPPPGVSDRKFRFELFSKFLGNSRNLEPFLFSFNEVPEYFLRMNSFKQSVLDQLSPECNGYLIDTSPAAIAGCLEDETVRDMVLKGPVMIVNFGNKHTMACIVKDGLIEALFEHHTFMLRKDPEKIQDYLTRLAENDLTSEEVFDDMGNGALIFSKTGIKNLLPIIVTGPNRNLIKKTSYEHYFAAPGGDMMITGPLGIISIMKSKSII